MVLVLFYFCYNTCMRLIEKLKGLNKYSIAVVVLALEVFGFIAFSFGSSYLLFGVLSIALTLLLVLFSFNDIKANGFYNLMIFIYPLLLFTIITGLSFHTRGYILLGEYSLAGILFALLGLLSMTFSGYLLSINPKFKIKHFFLVLFGALAALTLLNLIVNLVNFGPFYSIIYKGYYMYYGGARSDIPVEEMAYALEGFKFIEVSMTHYTLYPVLLLSSAVFLLHYFPKQEKKLFITYLCFTVLAVLSLIFVPSIYGLIGALVVGFVILAMFLWHKFEIFRKPLKYTMVVLGIFAILFLAVVVLNKQSFASGISNMIANNGLLNRLFNTNRIANKYAPLCGDMFDSRYIFGYIFRYITEFVPEDNPAVSSGSFFFDTFMTSGVFGVLALIVVLIVAFKGYKKYFLNSEDSLVDKRGLLIFPLIFFMYSFAFNDANYGIFYNIRQPIYLTGPFMISIFIFGYMLSKRKPLKMEEVNNEVK